MAAKRRSIIDDLFFPPKTYLVLVEEPPWPGYALISKDVSIARARSSALTSISANKRP